ncbi:MAG: hypothetical protein RR246_04170, partial [Clostridia bacterium]
MQDKEITKYGGFWFNTIVFTLTLIIASVFPVIARTLLSFAIETPSLSSLHSDASPLFDFIYPLMGVVTSAAYIGGCYYCTNYTAKKLAYKSRSSFDSMAAKLQIGIAMVVSTGINLYIAIPEKFSGAFGIQYWYLPATFASIFGIFDKTNLLADSTTADLGYANFVLKGITARFWGLIFLYVFIL